MTLRKKSYKKRNYKKRIYKKPKVTQAIKAYVKRTIHTNQENKIAFIAFDSLPLYNYAFAGSLYQSCTAPLTPYTSYLSITQGTGVSNRIGNQISVRRAYLKILLVSAPVDATNNITPTPQIINLFIYGTKPSYDSLSVIQNASLNSFFDSGNSYIGITSDLSDNMYDLNKDIIIPHMRKQYKLGSSTYFTPTNQQAFYNNDHKLNYIIKIDVTKWYPKKIIWNDTATTPTTRNLYFTLESCNSTGTAAPAQNIPVFYSWSMELQYEDS